MFLISKSFFFFFLTVHFYGIRSCFWGVIESLTSCDISDSSQCFLSCQLAFFPIDCLVAFPLEAGPGCLEPSRLRWGATKLSRGSELTGVLCRLCDYLHHLADLWVFLLQSPQRRFF